MTELNSTNGTHELAFEAFGARALVTAGRPEELERAMAVLPPGWRRCDVLDADRRFGLTRDGTGAYRVTDGGSSLAEGIPLELALGVLDSQVRMYVAINAADWVFVHAGTVAHNGRAIVIPGKSFAGKTTLVAALVRAGAVYYSDEFAVLDAQGLVHPYPKPLSLRSPNYHGQEEHPVESLGGVAGDEPLPIGLVVAATYRSGAEWAPERLSRGQGTLVMMENTVVAQDQPAAAMNAITRALGGAEILKGERGEADALAPLLLAQLSE